MDFDCDFFWRAFTRIGSRYYIVAGLAFFVFYIWKKKKWHYKKIQQRDAKTSDYLREILYSTGTVLVFSFFIYILHHPSVAPHTTRYMNVSDRGWLYYFALFPVLFFYMILIFIGFID